MTDPLLLTDAERAQQLSLLQAEVARLREDHHERSSDRADPSRLYVTLGVGLLLLTMLAVTALYGLGKQDANLIGLITGITGPSALALIAYGLQNHIREVYHLADGNLSVMRRDFNNALARIQQLQETRIAEAQATVPLVAEGSTLKIPAGVSGRIVDVEPPASPLTDIAASSKQTAAATSEAAETLKQIKDRRPGG